MDFFTALKKILEEETKKYFSEIKLYNSFSGFLNSNAYYLYNNIYLPSKPSKIAELKDKIPHYIDSAVIAENIFYEHFSGNSKEEILRKFLINSLSTNLLNSKEINFYIRKKEQTIKFLYYNSSEISLIPTLEQLVTRSLEQAEIYYSFLALRHFYEHTYYSFKNKIKNKNLIERLKRDYSVLFKNLNVEDQVKFFLSTMQPKDFKKWLIEFSKHSSIKIILDSLEERIKSKTEKYHWYDSYLDFEKEVMILDEKEYLLENEETIESLLGENIISGTVVLIKSLKDLFELIEKKYTYLIYTIHSKVINSISVQE